MLDAAGSQTLGSRSRRRAARVLATAHALDLERDFRVRRRVDTAIAKARKRIGGEPRQDFHRQKMVEQHNRCQRVADLVGVQGVGGDSLPFDLREALKGVEKI